MSDDAHSMAAEAKKISQCRVCQSRNIREFFDLGEQPLANSLPASFHEPEKKYPLSLSWCAECGCVQLNHTVDPKILFSSYVWVTGTSRVARDYAEQFCNEALRRAPDPRLVLEIASNDGTFLKPFIQKGIRVLGIDPAENVAELAKKDGVPTETAFFGRKTAEDIVARCGTADIVFARNVLPHVANTRDFVDGISAALADDGLGIIEVHYAKIILDELHYDSIYHEHLCYFTLKSLERLLRDYGLFVFDLMKSPISGGSIVAFIRKEKKPARSIVSTYRNIEAREGVNDLARWLKFADAARAHRAELVRLVHQAKTAGGVIVGYGASARSSTLLNFCGIDHRVISVIADQNPLKHNRFTAGTRIPIKNPADVFQSQPTHVLLLGWNFAEEIRKIAKEKYDFSGTFIVPLPHMPYLSN